MGGARLSWCSMSRTVWFAPGSTRRLVALLVLAVAVFMAALLIGTSGISLQEALAALGGAGDETRARSDA